MTNRFEFRDEVEDRQVGCLVGLAIGDALGAAVEFSRPGSFKPVTGYRAGGPHGLNAGEWTDDTSMALALADSILSVGWDLHDQLNRYLEWMLHGKYSVNGRCFDIGGTTVTSLQRFRRLGVTTGVTSDSACGNGSIMRLAPVAIVGATEDPDLSRVRFRESSMTTHANPLCIEACEFLGVTLEHLMYGFSEYLWLPTDNGYWHPKFKPLLNRSFMSGKAKGTGYVLDSLEAALWAFATSSSFEEAVLKAVNLGNDADTTGAVCGQLAGARWGLSGIPDHLIDGLAQFEMIYDVAKKLVDAKW